MTILVKDERAIFGHLRSPNHRQFIDHRKSFWSVRFRTRNQIKTWWRQQESPRPHALGAGLAVPIRTGGLGWPSPATRKRPPNKTKDRPGAAPRDHRLVPAMPRRADLGTGC